MKIQVILKIIKHCQEEGSGSGEVQGVLLGLVVDKRLEITNCFPFPRNTEEDETDESMSKFDAFLGFNRKISINALNIINQWNTSAL